LATVTSYEADVSSVSPSLTVSLETFTLYLNIKRIQHPKKNHNQQDDHINLAEKLAGVTVPDDWKMVQDKPNCISFDRLEKWEFQKRKSFNGSSPRYTDG